MLFPIMSLWLCLFSVFAGVYALYYLFLRVHARKPWKLKIDKNFMPAVSILIPVHNEEKTITQKLENTCKISYPKRKMQVILVDDASTDRTSAKIQEFIENNKLSINVIELASRLGKTKALNAALPLCKNDIVIVSDADCFWGSDILLKALPYLSDSSVGTVHGLGLIENSHESWLTREEKLHSNAMSLVRLGESKIYSTLWLEGGFCAHKRCAFEQFDTESGSDDSGTALSIVQKGYRTIFIPQATFTTEFPDDLRSKIKVKTRRANQLTYIWIKCLKLLVRRRLLLPKVIAIPEIFLFVFNPLLFIALVITTLIMLFASPILLIPFVLILSALNLISKVRGYFLQLVQSNIVLFYSIISYLRGKKHIVWD